jgi:hypothetical protein
MHRPTLLHLLGPLHLYVGQLTWHGATPSVTRLYR